MGHNEKDKKVEVAFSAGNGEGKDTTIEVSEGVHWTLPKDIFLNAISKPVALLNTQQASSVLLDEDFKVGVSSKVKELTLLNTQQASSVLDGDTEIPRKDNRQRIDINLVTNELGLVESVLTTQFVEVEGQKYPTQITTNYNLGEDNKYHLEYVKANGQEQDISKIKVTTRLPEEIIKNITSEIEGHNKENKYILRLNGEQVDYKEFCIELECSRDAIAATGQLKAVVNDPTQPFEVSDMTVGDEVETSLEGRVLSFCLTLTKETGKSQPINLENSDSADISPEKLRPLKTPAVKAEVPNTAIKPRR